MPSHSVALSKKNVFKNHTRMHDELTWSVLDGILESAKEDAEEKYNSLLMFDDVTVSLKDKGLQQLLKQTIFNRRHYRYKSMRSLCKMQKWKRATTKFRRKINYTR